MAKEGSGLAHQAVRVRALAKRRGPRWMQRWIWNWEFKAGRWSYLESADDPELFDALVERLAGGHLLDLGCGNGVVRCGLPDGAFSRYVGIDLSDEAIRRLENRTAPRAQPPDGELLLVGDFADASVLHQAGGQFDVILLHDSIYYVEDVVAFLRAIAELLTPTGVVIVRIHNRVRYAAFVDATRAGLDIVEERVPADAPHVLLVGRALQA